LEDNQDNTDNKPDDLMTTTSAFSHANIGQKNISKLMKNKPKKRNTASIQLHSTNIKVNNYLNARNLENDKDSQGDTNENALEPDALMTTSSVLYANIVEDDVQDSGKKRKENKRQKRLPHIIQEPVKRLRIKKD
ncbi:33526_t:CDS:2, partial [Gigaspora margarita]